MKYLCFIWAEGMPAPQDLAVIQRELPGWDEEMTRRGVRLLGRELDLPETAATVRVRDGQTLVTDGPFAETKGVHRRLQPARLRRPRRGDRGGGHVPDLTVPDARDPAVRRRAAVG